MRVGLGDLIGGVSVGGREVPYDQFVAPGLMAASAMNGAVYDSTMNVFHKLKWARIYDAVLATPMSAGDVAVGEITWALIRGQIYSVGFLGVMWGLGLVGSPWVIVRTAGLCVDRPRVRLARLRGHDVHARLQRLRVRANGDDADVPVLGDVLPAEQLRHHGPGWPSCRRCTTASRWSGQPTPACSRWSSVGHVVVLLGIAARRR